VKLKQVLPYFDAVIVQTHVASIADERAKPEFSAKPETNVVAQYGAQRGGSGSDHEPNIQWLSRASVYGGGNERCLDRQWKTNAL
jgi:hypothetical protein